MNILSKIVTGVVLASAGIVGVAAFFEARDNQFAYDLSSKTKKTYFAAQKAEYGDILAENTKKITAIQNENKISSMSDARKVLGQDITLYDLVAKNFFKNTRPLISFENQIGEDKYYKINDENSPAKLRQTKDMFDKSQLDKISRLAALSNNNKMREFDRFNIDFAQELRRYVEKNPKRFYEGQSLYEVKDKMLYVDYLQVLEKVIFNNVREKTNAKENTQEFATAYAEVAEKYFLPAIWTANEISLTNNQFVLE